MRKLASPLPLRCNRWVTIEIRKLGLVLGTITLSRWLNVLTFGYAKRRILRELRAAGLTARVR